MRFKAESKKAIIEFELKTKLWPEAQKREIELLLEKVYSFSAKRNPRKVDYLKFDEVRRTLGKRRHLLFSIIVAHEVFWKRILFDTKRGHLLSQLPSLASFMYMFFLILVASRFDLDVSISSQIIILSTWIMFETTALRASLGIKYEKGLITSLKFSKFTVVVGNVLAGLRQFKLLLLFLILSLISLSVYFKAFIIIPQFLVIMLNMIMLGLIFGFYIGLKSSSRDAKFWVPMVSRGLFLFSPMFPRAIEDPQRGVLTYVYMFNPLNSPYFLFELPSRNSALTFYVTAIMVIAVSFFVYLFRSAIRDENV